MRVLAAIFALTTLAGPYPAFAQLEASVGSPLQGSASGAPSAFKPNLEQAQQGSIGTPSLGSLRRYGTSLANLKGDETLGTRGAKDAQVYRLASPAVVLIVTEDGLGSGALISASGEIITNWHVVGASEYVGVVFKPDVEGKEITEADLVIARVLKRDQTADLALIKVDQVPAGVKPLALGSLTSVTVGNDVHAIGHPTGEAWTYTKGLVSQIRRNYSWLTKDQLQHKATVIQTQTPINPGNSGGPLLDDNLNIIGVNAFKSEGEGLNFAIAADDVKSFLASPGNRIAAKVAAPDKKKCDARVVSSSRYDKYAADSALVDLDCDGRGDVLVVSPDNRSEPIAWLMDDDGDGKIDTILLDEGRDGEFDQALFDTDSDGKLDLAGYYRAGEDKPYRYEPYGD